MMEENNKKGLVQGFKNVKTEYSKISWPKREELMKQTVSVIAFSFLIGSIVFFYDVVYSYLFSFIVR